MASVHQIPTFLVAQPADGRKRSNTTSTNSASISTYDEKGYPPQLESLTQPRPRTKAVCGYSYRAASTSDGTSAYSYTLTSHSSFTQARSTKSSLCTGPPRNLLLPVLNSCGSSSSGKSVRFSDVEDCAVIGLNHQRYAPNALKVPSKSSLLGRKNKGILRSFTDKDTQVIKDASLAVDEVLRDLTKLVQKFKCPSELHFSGDTTNPLILLNVEKNKPFIKQLHKLDALRTRLAGISTHGEEYVEKKHMETSAAIEAALEKMKKQQLSRYQQFIRGALDDLTLHLNACVKHFEYPSELDFHADSADGLVLSNTERNQSFITHLRMLDWFQQELNKISTSDNEQLQDRSRDIGTAIDRIMLKAKKHQLHIFHCQNRA